MLVGLKCQLGESKKEREEEAFVDYKTNFIVIFLYVNTFLVYFRSNVFSNYHPYRPYLKAF